MASSTRWPETLWIVRHGESAGNLARAAATAARLPIIDIEGRDVDVPLSELGERQSRALGRWFSQEEDQPGRDSVIVLGYGIWQRLFGGDRGILGSTVVVEGRNRTVIGIMPKDFSFPLGAGAWAPTAARRDVPMVCSATQSTSPPD